MRSPRSILSLLLVLLTATASAQQKPAANVVSVGEEGEYLATVEKADLKPKEVAMAASQAGGRSTKPTVAMPIWIISCAEKEELRSGDKRTWAIRYAGWKAGDHDLRELLSWPEEFTKEMIPPMLVTIINPLAHGHRGDLEPIPRHPLDLTPALSSGLRWTTAGVWAAGVLGLAWLAWLRRDAKTGAYRFQGNPEHRKLLEGMRVGARAPLLPQTRAELQRQFLKLLLQDFVGAEGTMKEMLEKVQQHPEGGPLMTQFDEWLESALVRPTPVPQSVTRYLEGVLAGPSGAGKP